MRRTRLQRPIEYRDRQDRVWSVSEVAVLKVVSPAIDGPNLALVIRFEHRARSVLRAGSGIRIGASRRRCIGYSRASTRRLRTLGLDLRRLKPWRCG